MLNLIKPTSSNVYSPLSHFPSLVSTNTAWEHCQMIQMNLLVIDSLQCWRRGRQPISLDTLFNTIYNPIISASVSALCWKWYLNKYFCYFPSFVVSNINICTRRKQTRSSLQYIVNIKPRGHVTMIETHLWILLIIHQQRKIFNKYLLIQ